MRGLVSAVSLAAACAAVAGGSTAGPAAAAPARSWAAPQIRAVVAHGLLATSVDAFRPDDALTGTALSAALQTLWAQQHPVAPPATIPMTTVPATTVPTAPGPPAPTDPAGPEPAPVPAQPAAPAEPRIVRALASKAVPLTMRELDVDLVSYLALDDAAQAVRDTLRRAGLQPPDGTGSEVVARILGLRLDHPAAQDDLELLPSQPATRAEAAYSLARLLRVDTGTVDWIRGLALSFALPDLTPWQQRVLQRAVHFVGYPYVWGGTSEYREAPFGVVAPGGFDCSGFVWRVYKAQPFPGGGDLQDVLRGRTTYQMSGEVPRAKRVQAGQLVPGDVMFFGHGPRSSPSEVGHTGIYLGGGWLIHSSGEGVTIVPFDGWYRRSFAWGRRPLHEAGLA